MPSACSGGFGHTPASLAGRPGLVLRATLWPMHRIDTTESKLGGCQKVPEPSKDEPHSKAFFSYPGSRQDLSPVSLLQAN